jgi:hypothetical protein
MERRGLERITPPGHGNRLCLVKQWSELLKVVPG